MDEENKEKGKRRYDREDGGRREGERRWGLEECWEERRMYIIKELKSSSTCEQS